mmetsp:Transcript_69717/g.110775  ORF Transcript_69717/g.110775 Transcript_69717/m.110775 type:complete len:87 (+) Transcript_69717:215-475(+)
MNQTPARNKSVIVKCNLYTAHNRTSHTDIPPLYTYTHAHKNNLTSCTHKSSSNSAMRPTSVENIIDIDGRSNNEIVFTHAARVRYL